MDHGAQRELKYLLGLDREEGCNSPADPPL
jgi:hypothetical protein